MHEIKNRRFKRAIVIGVLVFILMTLINFADRIFNLIPVDGFLKTGLIAGIVGLVASFIADRIVPVRDDISETFD